MKTRTVIFIFFLIIIILMLDGCTVKKAQVVDGLLTGKPCEAPCWNNLTPGKTSEQEVVQFLNNLNPKDWVKTAPNNYPSGCKSYRTTDLNSDNVTTLFDLYIDNGMLILIEYHPPIKDTLSEIVSKFGEPEFIRPLLIEGPEGPFYDLTIFYPKKGMAFKIDIRGFDVGKVSKNMKVQYYIFYQSGDITNYYRIKYSCQLTKEVGPEKAKSEVATHILPWTGFGDVQVIKTK